MKIGELFRYMKPTLHRKLIWSIGLFIVVMSGCSMNNWEVAETQNLSIYYKKGSYADRNIEEAKRIYEYSFNVAEQYLPRINKVPKLKVFLYEKLRNKGFSRVNDREVHYRFSEEFRLTSVHEMMHVFLYELNPDAPLRVEEGICRIKEGKRKRFKGNDYQIMYYQLVKLVSEERWSLNEVFQDKYKDDDEGNIAAAFIMYATNKLGEPKFWEFYQELDKDNWAGLLKKYFGQDIPVIDQEFKAYVKTIPDPPEAFKFKFSRKTAHLHK
ncbi:MAG: hypothetical protein A2Y03_00250 [Omnitrophica WOR_2 bacterium GWF2_38_59]|nr:MAG: hypothetical protein A2Y03_00250 [Omnitrophica WOR_2 bacterium GWF2_38_59]OGX47700.1 MAG: hypothetical protein A2243_00140 [Omnitrophica WOR_2 bacterium RIFOXYA2_FULL_38_17]OGX51397.1 MAG: hypothetical protein A2267_07435 [Omnitrophica WOR_2 bacterium RIFOXYA12_FULL_38_10]OGX56671.1 MAG: hypothetical protein A2306_08455 [Omnitrophica WOR_2 bacterium RIFOXYB2_FULL_38_16]HBG62595.1 hypothetical protein [Candidatus Omnitrophota bacterium]